MLGASKLPPDPMTDASSGIEPRRSLLERLSALLLRAPEDREQLLGLLRGAHDRELLDDDALSMIEGVLQVAELSARDIMVPRARMDVIDVSQAPAEFLPRVIAAGHSRFPVVDGDLDNVIGVLHAKSLLQLGGAAPPPLRQLVRPAVFIPESKPLNVLLRDFRASHTHLAIVVDEYGAVSGLITIEDVLEQIVGDIEDEFDEAEVADEIVTAGAGAHGPRYRLRAMTPIETFNRRFDVRLPDDAFDTVGGLVTAQLGHVPQRGDEALIGEWRFEVLRADARQAHLLQAERLPRAATEAAAEHADG
jgi:magnesium and cobalt transporter